MSGDRARFFAAVALGMALTYTGSGEEGAELLREANEVLERSDALKADPHVLTAAALPPLWLRETHRGRALAARAIETARTAGAIGALPGALWMAGRDAAASDRFAVAVARYEEAIRLSRETGQATALCAGLAGLACVEARQGHEEACRAHAREAFELAEERGLGFYALWTFEALGDLELGLGDRRSGRRPPGGEGAPARAARHRRPRSVAGAELSKRCCASARHARPRRRLERLRAGRRGQGPALVARPAGALPAGCSPRRRARAASRRRCGCTRETPDRFEEARTRLGHGERLRRARRRVRGARAAARRARRVRRARRRAVGRAGRAPSSRRPARPRAGATPARSTS